MSRDEAGPVDARGVAREPRRRGRGRRRRAATSRARGAGGGRRDGPGRLRRPAHLGPGHLLGRGLGPRRTARADGRPAARRRRTGGGRLRVPARLHRGVLRRLRHRPHLPAPGCLRGLGPRRHRARLHRNHGARGGARRVGGREGRGGARRLDRHGRGPDHRRVGRGREHEQLHGVLLAGHRRAGPVADRRPALRGAASRGEPVDQLRGHEPVLPDPRPGALRARAAVAATTEPGCRRRPGAAGRTRGLAGDGGVVGPARRHDAGGRGRHARGRDRDRDP